MYLRSCTWESRKCTLYIEILVVKKEGFAANLGHFNIGTGDLIFYSMIPSSVFLLIDLPSAFLSIFLIHLGLILTLYLLKRFEIFPGLPIPVALSLVPYLLFYWIIYHKLYKINLQFCNWSKIMTTKLPKKICLFAYLKFNSLTKNSLSNGINIIIEAVIINVLIFGLRPLASSNKPIIKKTK